MARTQEGNHLMQPLRGGDAIFFWGTGFVSEAMSLLTDGASHVATILDPDVPLPSGMKQHEIHIIESTIYRGVSGVQVNPLADRIAEYDRSGTIVAAYLSEGIRAFLKWPLIWTYAARAIGEHYNVPEIAAYLANMALPGKLQIDPLTDLDWQSHPVVCSEFRAELLRVGGLPCLDPFRFPPSRLWSGRMYTPNIEVLLGRAPGADAMSHFNTV